jgi:hypothetical protein
MDVLYIGITLVFLALSWGLIALCVGGAARPSRLHPPGH